MKEQKKLSDYLHLYLGCDLYIHEQGETPFKSKFEAIDVTGRPIAKEYDHHILWKFDEVKPILRPLSDMTEDEFNEIKLEFSVDILNAYISPATYHDRPWHVIVLENRLQTNTLKFNDGMILLRKHFDLFGLIESGLAIDKTTYQQPL